MNLTKIQPVRVNELVRSKDRDYLDLSGEWEFELDPEDAGEERERFRSPAGLPDRIQVPGCLEAQGKGLRHLPLRRPGWAGTCDLPYRGVSWYQTSFRVPPEMQGKRLQLNFGGVATDCRIWLNGEFLGAHHTAAVPFGFDVSGLVRWDAANRLTVKVENNHDYSSMTPENTHGLGSTTMELRWSGIYRAVELVATDRVWIADLRIVPEAGKFHCDYWLNSTAPVDFIAYQAAVAVSGWSDGTGREGKEGQTGPDGSGRITVELTRPHVWSDADPYLYRVELEVRDAAGVPRDSLVERTGLRSITFDGEHLLLNDIPVYLRGDMVHFHWPDTVCPTTNRDDLRAKLRTYREFGFNFLRHHTHFPSVEYLEVCDELGLLCHNELGVVGGSWRIAPEYRETMWESLIRRDRNHPALIIWCLGNELEASDQQSAAYAGITFGLDQTRLLLSNSPGYFIGRDGSRRRAPIYHELRKAGASYIDTAAKGLYKGALRPWRMAYAEERIAASGLSELLPLFVANSQKLQARCRKLVLEQLRLRDDIINDAWNFHGLAFQGYQLCTFRDSGSFTWGVVNDYFQPKNVAPAELRQYNGDSVLLWARKWQDRVFEYGNRHSIPLTLKCSHYGKEAINGAELSWEIRDEAERIVAGGGRTGLAIARGELRLLATDAYRPPVQSEPQALKLRARLAWEGGTLENQWDFWIFPAPTLEAAPVPVYVYDCDPYLDAALRERYPFIREYRDGLEEAALLVTGSLNEVLLEHLGRGGRALLTGRYSLDGERSEWGAGRSEYPRGTIIADHPLFARFPHRGWCDLPFAGMISDAAELDGLRNDLGVAANLQEWPPELKPLIMNIPSFKDEHPARLGLLFEAAAGPGKLMVSTLDFGSPYAANPATRYFLDQLLRYLVSDQFRPAARVGLDFLRQRLGQPVRIRKESNDSKKEMDQPL